MKALPREGTLRTASAAFVATMVVSLVGALPATLAETDARPAGQRLMLDLSNWQDRTEVVAPSHLPAPSEATKIGPGSQLIIRHGEFLFLCTAAFVFKGTKVISGVPHTSYYLGSAGHCFLPGRQNATHGPGGDPDAARRNRVYVCVSECQFGGQMGFLVRGKVVRIGSVAYARQSGSGGSIGNDFGLVQIPKALTKYLRRSIPVWGGPSRTERIGIGSVACLYGGGSLVGETYLTMARAGTGIGTTASYWEAAIPNAGGDSGAPLNTCARDAEGLHGRGAVGVLTHGLEPFAGVYTFGTTVPRAIRLARQAGISLVIQYGK